jgi:nitric oxide reductase activation protein
MRNLVILAKWLAQQAGVDVLFKNVPTASISPQPNGKKVILIPSAWCYSDDPDAAALLEGVIDHEALGHGRFTDLGAVKSALENDVIKSQYEKGLWNIFEDIYIERRAISTLPGVKANLSRTVQILLKKDFFGNPSDFASANNAAGLLQAGLLNILRARLIEGQGAILQENVDALEVFLPQKLGKVWDDVLAVALEVEHTTSTQENIDLALKVMALLKSISEETPSEAQDQSEAQEDAQEQDQGGGDVGDQPVDADDGSNALQDDPGGAEQEESNGSEGQGADTQGQESEGGSYSQENIDTAQAIVDDQEVEQATTEIADALSEIISAIASASKREVSSSKQLVPVGENALRVASQVKSICDDLQDALVAESRCQTITGLSGKRLNNRALSRVALGNSRVFRTKHEAEGLSTAVSILCDKSGSMRDQLDDQVSRFDARVGLMFGLADLLDEFEVPFELSSFSDVFQTFKTFPEDWSRVRRRNEVPELEGATYTGSSMQQALGSLVLQPQDRRLMIIITDGDAGDLEVLMSCYAEAQEMGIEIATVIVGSLVPSVRALADKFGFKAISTNSSTAIGRFAVERVLECI